MEPLLPGDPPKIGAYRLEARLGAGGMGRVYLGRSAGGLPVAVKVIHDRFARDERFRARFVREVATAQAVSGAFTAPVVDADPEADRPWLATVYVPGVPLQEAVTRHGPLQTPATYALGAGLAEALVSMHRAGVVHRDLKPSNVLLGVDGPRVIDFGIARAAEGSDLTAEGAVIGSPGYMAPEQAAGREVGPSGDVFAFGAVLAFTVTGQGPFGTGSAAVLTYRVIHTEPLLDGIGDPFLRSLVAECLNKDPERRPAPAQLLERLAPLAGPPRGTDWLPAPVVSSIGEKATIPPPVSPGVPRRQFAVLASVGGVVLAAGGTATVVAASRVLSREPTQPPPSRVTDTPGRPVAPPGKGKELWRSRVEYAARPAATGGLLLVPGGELTALDVRNGKKLWSTSLDAHIYECASTLVDGLAFGATQDGFLYALDTKNKGATRWSKKVMSRFELAPVVMGDVVFALGPDNPETHHLEAFNARTGKSLWRKTFPAGRVGHPVEFVAGAGLVVVAERVLQAFDARTGDTAWSHPMSEPGRPVIAGDVVYAVGAEALHALRAGQVVWTYRPETLVRQEPVAGDGLVCVGTGNGTVHAVDATTGRARWQAQSEGRGLITVAGGLIYNFAAKQVQALDVASGRPRWTYRIDGNSAFTPVVADGVAYAGVRAELLETTLIAVRG